MAFTLESTQESFRKLSGLHLPIIGKDVHAFAETARKNLEKIENNEVPRKNSNFKAILTDIETDN